MALIIALWLHCSGFAFVHGIRHILEEQRTRRLVSKRTAVDPLVVGLTGNIATGKSTVSAYLRGKGAYGIDADKVAHQVMEPGQEAYTAIVAEFGTDILASDGSVDRGKLAKIVFADSEKLGRLEQIVHPAVYRAVYKEIEENAPPVVILEAVKLLEAGSTATLCDEIWVVVADPEEQVRRAEVNRGMSEAETRRRMSMQSPQASKMNQADVVIYNNGTLQELYVQLDELWRKLLVRHSVRLEGVSD
jgi:dephospho-CoA kinase